MAGQTRTINYDALLTMTADNYHKSGVINDGIFKSNQTIKELSGGKLKTYSQGGAKIQVNLMYGKNETFKSYSRYGLLDTAPQDGFAPAFYDWCQYAGTVSIDGLSKAQNKGKPQIQKLLREKVKQLTMSKAETLNEHLFDCETLTTATGNGGKNIIPLTHYIQLNPVTGTIDVGGIDESAETWWQNQTLDSVATTGTMFADELRNLYMSCSYGMGGAPDLIIMDPGTFRGYEAHMDVKVRYSYTDKASVGFEAIKFKGAKIIWDQHVGDMDATYNWDHASYDGATGSCFMVNTKFLDMVCMPGMDFAPQGFQSPTNQDASVGKWLFYGQLVCSNRRKLGVLTDIDVSEIVT